MVAPHAWFECRPAIVALPGGESTSALGLTALDRVWAGMTDAERHRFHRFTCEGDQSPATMAVIHEMRQTITAAIED